MVKSVQLAELVFFKDFFRFFFLPKNSTSIFTDKNRIFNCSSQKEEKNPYSIGYKLTSPIWVKIRIV
jgi:hypothetical protein